MAVLNRSWNLDATVRLGWRKSDGYITVLVISIPDDKTSIIAMPRVIISILSTPCFWHYNDVIKVA